MKKTKQQKMNLIVGVIILFVLISKVNIANAQDIKDMYECVVEVDYSVIDGNDNKFLLKKGCGIGISDEEGTVTNVITNLSNVSVTEEELDSFRQEYSLNSDKERFVTEIVIDKDITIEGNPVSESQSLNISVIRLNQQLYNRPVLIFDMDEDIEDGDTVYSIGNLEKGINTGNVYKVVLKNRNRYIAHDIPVADDNIGGALLNENNELIGIMQLIDNETQSYALSTLDIGYVLDNLGIAYLKADHNSAVDTDKLEAVVRAVENMDLSNYTEESSKLLREKIQEAKKCLDKNDITQDEIDDAYTQLTMAQESLVQDESLSIQMIIAIIVISVLTVSVVVLILVIVLGKKRRIRKENEKKELEAKRARIDNIPYKASNNMFEIKNQYISTEHASVEEPTDTRRGKAIQNTNDGTIVLMEHEIKDSKKTYALINKLNNEKIILEESNYYIGKDPGTNNIAIPRDSISRNHCIIIWNNGYYIQDFGSTNGTFINQTRLEPNKVYSLTEGDEIRIADLPLVFGTI